MQGGWQGRKGNLGYTENFVYKSITYIMFYDKTSKKKRSKVEGIMRYSTVSRQTFLFCCHNKNEEDELRIKFLQ